MKKVDLTYIIDDDKIFIFVLKKVMQKNENFNQIVDFRNAEDVIEILFNNKSKLPDVILLDINMPLIDGWQFLERIEQLEYKKSISVFIMSSSIDPNDISKSKSFSTVKDFISKPINNEKLNSLVASLT